MERESGESSGGSDEDADNQEYEDTGVEDAPTKTNDSSDAPTKTIDSSDAPTGERASATPYCCIQRTKRANGYFFHGYFFQQ